MYHLPPLDAKGTKCSFNDGTTAFDVIFPCVTEVGDSCLCALSETFKLDNEGGLNDMSSQCLDRGDDPTAGLRTMPSELLGLFPRWISEIAKSTDSRPDASMPLQRSSKS